MPVTLPPDSSMALGISPTSTGSQRRGVAGSSNPPRVAANGLPATLCSCRPGLACVMNSGEMLRPSHMTKTRPQSIRYAPSGCTAAVVSGAGAGRTILRQHRRCFRHEIVSG